VPSRRIVFYRMVDRGCPVVRARERDSRVAVIVWRRLLSARRSRGRGPFNPNGAALAEQVPTGGGDEARLLQLGAQQQDLDHRVQGPYQRELAGSRRPSE